MSNTDFDDVAGSTVYDSTGEKVGKVEQLYISETTNLPTWVSVKTGLFGLSHSLVPLAGATHRGDRLDVAHTKDQIKDAPHLDSEHGTTTEQDQELLRHYGLTDTTSGWDTYGKHAATPTHGTTGHDTLEHRATQPRADHDDVAASRGEHDRAARLGTEELDAVPGGAHREPHLRDQGHVRDEDHGREEAHDAADTGRNVGDAASVVRSEERLNVGKDTVATGRARLRKYVITEQQSVNVPVTREEVRVVREPIDADTHTGAATIGEDAAEVVLHEERVTVSKETVPVERVGLAVDQVTDDHTVTEDVRKEQIDTGHAEVGRHEGADRIETSEPHQGRQG